MVQAIQTDQNQDHHYNHNHNDLFLQREFDWILTLPPSAFASPEMLEWLKRDLAAASRSPSFFLLQMGQYKLKGKFSNKRSIKSERHLVINFVII